MRLILLLVALLIVGILVYKQIGGNKTVDSGLINGDDRIEVPKIPTKPGELKKFQKDMNQYMNDVSASRAKKMEDELNQQ